MTHTLGQHTISLRPPASPTVRWEILACSHINGVRASAAALAACWNGPGRPAAKYAALGYSVPRFGAAVLDELLERGVGFEAITKAGAAALEVLGEGLVNASEVDAAEDFTGPSAEESTG